MYWRTMMVPQWRRAVFIAVASSLFSTVAQALGVGELKVYSALDEPLEAEILLAPSGTKEIKTLQARLVARPDFDVATDVTAPISREIRVTVTQRRDGQHLLKLYSEQPVREPYLRFLLQLDWAGGRLTREFVALIDPAEFRPVGAASVDDTGAETALATTAEPPAAEAQPAPPAEAVTVTAPPPASAASGPAAKPGPASISVSGPPDAGPDSPTQGAEAAVPTPTTAAARKTGPKKQVVVNEPSKITQRNADEQRQRLASEIEAWAKTRKQVRSEDETTRSDVATGAEEEAAESEAAQAPAGAGTNPGKRGTPREKTGRVETSAAPAVEGDAPLLQWAGDNTNRLLIILLALLALLVVMIGGVWASLYAWRRWYRRKSKRVAYGERRNGEGRRRQFLPVAIERRRGPRRDSDRVVSEYRVVHADDDKDDDVGHLEIHTEEPTERALQKAIAAYPQQHSLKVKLLALYYQRNNKQAFESLLNRLYADLEVPGLTRPAGSAFDALVHHSLAEPQENEEDMHEDDRIEPSVISGISPSKAEHPRPPEDLRDADTVIPDLGSNAPGDGIPVLSFSEASSQTSGGKDAQSDMDKGLQKENDADLAPGRSDVVRSADTGRKKAGHSMKDTNDAGLEALSIDDLIDISSADGHALLDDIEFEGVDVPDEPVLPKRDPGSSIGGKEDDRKNLAPEEKSPATKDARQRQWRDPAIKIDLAKAYIDMGDAERARHILDEVLKSWNRGDGTDG